MIFTVNSALVHYFYIVQQRGMKETNNAAKEKSKRNERKNQLELVLVIYNRQ